MARKIPVRKGKDGRKAHMRTIGGNRKIPNIPKGNLEVLDTDFRQGQVRKISEEEPLYDDLGNRVDGDKVKILKEKARTLDLFNFKTRQVMPDFPKAMMNAYLDPKIQ